MLNNIKVKLPQGLVIPNAYVEIQSARASEIKATEKLIGFDRVDGQLKEIEPEVTEGVTRVSEIHLTFSIWANQQVKQQGFPSFTPEATVLKFSEHPELAERFDSFAETATVKQKFEELGDSFLKKTLLA